MELVCSLWCHGINCTLVCLRKQITYRSTFVSLFRLSRNMKCSHRHSVPTGASFPTPCLPKSRSLSTTPPTAPRSATSRLMPNPSVNLKHCVLTTAHSERHPDAKVAEELRPEEAVSLLLLRWQGQGATAIRSSRATTSPNRGGGTGWPRRRP